MKKTFLLILILIMSISLFSQDTEEVTEIAIQPDSLVVDSLSNDSTVIAEPVILTHEDKLCQEDLLLTENR